jgi:HK97 family phage major capsid protein
VSANQELLDRLITARSEVRSKRQALIDRAEREGRKELSDGETTAFRALTDRLEGEGGLDDRIGEISAELTRSGHGNPAVKAVTDALSGAVRGRGNALAPLGFDGDQLRAMHAALATHTPHRMEARDFSTADSQLPPQLAQYVVGKQHENRLLNRLPTLPMETSQIEILQHTSTTGAAGAVAEGALKPEAVLTIQHLTLTAVKLAVHGAVSWEIAEDFINFSSYTYGELTSMVIDKENDSFINGTGTSGEMLGPLSTSGILTHASGSDPTPLDSLELAATALRVGSALATADLLVLHPSTWSAIRRTKDSQDRYLTQPDPTVGEANSAWGIPVITTTQIAAGAGVMLDSTKFGRVYVRSPLSVRTGWTEDDFTRNLTRFVAEERVVLAVERPAAVLKLTGLPTS